MGVKKNLQDFRICWESLVGCSGNCSGCNISRVKNIDQGLWSEDKLFKATNLSKKLFQDFINENGNNFRAKLFLAAGDYLGLSEQNIVKVFDYANEAIPKNIKKKTILFTANAVSKLENLEKKIALLQKISKENNIELYVEMIIDLKKILLDSYREKYFENIKLIATSFDASAGVIQIGNDFLETQVSYEDLLLFRDKLKIQRFEFALNPTQTNGFLLKKDIKNILNYIMNFCGYWDSDELSWFKNSNDKTVFFDINRVFAFKIKQIKDSFVENINDFLEYGNHSSEKNSIYIQHNGDISNFLSGFANIYPCGYSLNKNYILGNIFNDNSELSLILNDMYEKTYKTLFLNIFKKKSCASCKYNLSCALLGGMHLIENTGLDVSQENICPLGIKEKFSIFEKDIQYSDCNL